MSFPDRTPAAFLLQGTARTSRSTNIPHRRFSPMPAMAPGDVIATLGQREPIGRGVLHGFRERFLPEPAQAALLRSRRVRFERDDTRAYREPGVRVLLEEGGHYLGHLDQTTADALLEVLPDRIVIGELLHRHPRLYPDDTPVDIWAVGNLESGPVLDASIVENLPGGAHASS